jgi:cysteinyl-tRNA synthetase
MSIRAMIILGADPLDERWESHDETSAALAAVDVRCRRAAPRGCQVRRDWAEAEAIRDRLGGRHRGHRHRRRTAMGALDGYTK